MGKRKLHNTSYWQCDWTGYPLKQAYCYFPTWTNGKLVKKGSYCNWESVVAHAQLLHADAPEELERVREHVNHMCGTVVSAAPHFTHLSHIKSDGQNLSMTEFHKECTLMDQQITAVKILPNGDVFEVIVAPEHFSVYFAPYLHPPYNGCLQPSHFRSMRKKGQRGPERDLTVWYYNTKELPFNKAASDLFKMQLYGDVLLVQQSREACFLPRERYISYFKAQFEEGFSKKRKRPAEVPCMTTAQYQDVKGQIQDTLNRYEEAVSAEALPPQQTAHVRASTKSGRKLGKAAAPSTHGAPVPPPQVLATV